MKNEIYGWVNPIGAVIGVGNQLYGGFGASHMHPVVREF